VGEEDKSPDDKADLKPIYFLVEKAPIDYMEIVK